MGKSNSFSGQPILSQLINLLPKAEIHRIVKKYDSDRYCKKLFTWDHLITLLYSSYQHCTALREVYTGLIACGGRLVHVGMKYVAPRSTLSDANKNRSSLVFEEIFQQCYKSLSRFLPDSRIVDAKFLCRLFIIDSTTITLFKNILKAAGRPPADGKTKGGVKVHALMNAAENVPGVVRISSASTNDTKFFKLLFGLKAQSIAVFDKGYTGFYQLLKLSEKRIFWVTRQRSNSIVNVICKRQLTKKEIASGILKDETVLLGHQKKEEKIKCRRVTYYDKENQRTFEFITNYQKVSAVTIADIYKQRWQIEILFRRLKQNMQLDYFLGDNENAIRIQIWCTLIADLLLKVATKGIKKKWSFSNLAALVRLHLMNYTNLTKFLNNPEKTRIYNPEINGDKQLKFQFSSA